MDYITLVCGIIACIIGVLTFIAGMVSRAKNEGVMVQKLNQALDGIEELKTDVKGVSNTQQHQALAIQAHEEQIKTLFKAVNNTEVTNKALITIMESLQRMESRGE